LLHPKRDLPIHAESYNPTEEYLMDDKEREEFEKWMKKIDPLTSFPRKLRLYVKFLFTKVF